MDHQSVTGKHIFMTTKISLAIISYPYKDIILAPPPQLLFLHSPNYMENKNKMQYATLQLQYIYISHFTKTEMAHLKLNNFISSKVYFTEECWRFRGTPYGSIKVESKGSKTVLKRTGGNAIYFSCCSVSNSTSSSASAEEQQVDQLVINEKYDAMKGQFGNLWNEYGWQVRRMVEKEDEMRKVAQVQAEAFYEPVFFFTDLFFDFFKVSN